MTCSKCGAARSGDALFCPSCGQPYETNKPDRLVEHQGWPVLVIGVAIIIILYVAGTWR